MSILKAENLHKSFKSNAEDLSILDGVNLEINAGERIAIIGQSGSGKSTFLQIAGLLDTPTSGDVFIEGVSSKNMKDREKTDIRSHTFGFVYQNNHLLREFTALENVLMPAQIQGKLTAEHKKRAEYLLKLVGLEERMSHFPSELSGGEQQRVAIARALMNKPKLLLADEPTGNLDPETATEVAALFDQLVKDEGMALLLVTHNDILAKSMDKIYHMRHGVLS
ncbi:MAG: lipoprotein-releasing system ATP-binding protein [Alphaproteobacteria bacterium]|jgi:lipoprotein-releasing system ATP-binding protein